MNRQGRQEGQTRTATVKAPRSEPDAELDELAHKVIGAAIEVHKALGSGFLESVYEEALAVELINRGISFERQKPFAIDYKGKVVGEGRIDLLVGGRLVVELKTVEQFAPIHRAQVLHYLKAGRYHLGLLINFKTTVLKNGIERVIRS